jgi:pyruvate formate-lyase activating enzyme-like uncharacterized protein
VLFITGLCSTKCFYCPISDLKLNKDVIYANEWPVNGVKQLIEEIRLCSSKGVGITGGDPLVRLDRTVQYIRQLKKAFGRKFHIHLYTPLTLVSETNLGKLYRAGLDEIRFHPDLYSSSLWGRLKLASKYKWDIGVEIPLIPGREKMTRKMIDYIATIKEIKFLNLNELEISDTNANHLVERGFVPKDRISYGVKGSSELGLKLLKYINARKFKLNVHYCTTTLKDKVQLANRIRLRAKNVAEKYDKVTGEGILIRGAVYLPGLKPGFGYRNKVAEIKNKAKIIRRLEKISRELKKKYKISSSMMSVDSKRLRLLTSEAIARKINEKNLITAIVKEFPTYDQFEVEIRFL